MQLRSMKRSMLLWVVARSLQYILFINPAVSDAQVLSRITCWAPCGPLYALALGDVRGVHAAVDGRLLNTPLHVRADRFFVVQHLAGRSNMLILCSVVMSHS
jgi:hypothetical protein